MAATGSCQRRALLTLSLAVVMIAGCGRDSGDRDEPTPPIETGGTASVEPVDVTQDFAITAQDYAQLTVAAWAAPDPIRLAELAAPDVRDQIIELPGPPNQDWTFVRCAGDQARSDCSFYNADGDELVLGVDHELLGGPQATVEARFEVTGYPEEMAAYVAEFVTAWQAGNLARMHNLAVAGAVEDFAELAPRAEPATSPAGSPTPAEPPVEYDVGATADELTEVVVTIDGEHIWTYVSGALLGAEHAIRSATVER